MPTEGAKKVRLVAAVEGPGPTGTYTAGVVSGALSYVAAGCAGPTREEALSAVAARLTELGYDAEISAHDSSQAAQNEVRRRQAAEDLLRCLAPPYASRLAELLPHRPDAIEALGILTDALSAAAQGRTNPVEPPPIADGRLVCPGCGNERPGYGFEATADALMTVSFDARGETTDTSGVEKRIDPRGYRDVSCRWCGAAFGDLSPDDVYSLAAYGRGRA